LTLRNHHRCIHDPKKHNHSNYIGMPFFEAWDPLKGGSFAAGARWIVENLGPKPLGTSMHVVNHELGVVPGNLEWTYPAKQAREQMFKIIADLRNRVKELEACNAELEHELVFS
jgi:hypothetical protein